MIEIEQNQEVENNSGLGKNANVPESVAKKYNWGALLWNWFWCFRYKPLLGIFYFICLGFSKTFARSNMPEMAGLINIILFILAIWIGKKGNTWAWQKYSYKSEQQFHKIQKIWVGFIIVTFLIGVIGAMTIPTIMGNRLLSQHRVEEQYINKELTKAITAQNGSISTETGEALAVAFSKQFQVKSINGNIIEDTYGRVYAFNGNGQKNCKYNPNNIELNCTVTVDTNGLEKGPNEVGTKQLPKDRWRYVITEDSIIPIEDLIQE